MIYVHVHDACMPIVHVILIIMGVVFGISAIARCYLMCCRPKNEMWCALQTEKKNETKYKTTIYQDDIINNNLLSLKNLYGHLKN